MQGQGGCASLRGVEMQGGRGCTGPSGGCRVVGNVGPGEGCKAGGGAGFRAGGHVQGVGLCVQGPGGWSWGEMVAGQVGDAGPRMAHLDEAMRFSLCLSHSCLDF